MQVPTWITGEYGEATWERAASVVVTYVAKGVVDERTGLGNDEKVLVLLVGVDSWKMGVKYEKSQR